MSAARLNYKVYKPSYTLPKLRLVSTYALPRPSALFLRTILNSHSIFYTEDVPSRRKECLTWDSNLPPCSVAETIKLCYHVKRLTY
jgi:hypothetical protein